MSKIEIRKLSLGEAAPILNWLTAYSFTSNPPITTAEYFAERFSFTDEQYTFLALYEDGSAAASAGAGPMTQNVRCKIVDSAGVFMVATNPAHRRKGYAFQLLKALFKQIKEAGFGFSTLYPFRESFYERLGYTTWFPPITAEINIQSLAPLLDKEIDTDLEQLEFLHSTEIYLEFLKRYQQKTHGMAAFVKNPDPDPERHKAWQVISRINGELDGIMLYDLKGDAPTQFKMNIHRFYYLSNATRYNFLNWIARHIDQANQVSIVLPPFEQPQTWLSDLEVSLSVGKINPMGRVLDIEKLNGLPVGDGHFSARISDPTCPWNEGVWVFESQDGRLSVTKANTAGCDLSIQAISSLVFGNVPPKDYAYRGWGEIPAGVQTQMTNLFPPATPHLHEYF